ncbi:MAG: aminotransferase class I/II-fold pyridoxal phosphate-dependent enzyme, partial [Planctomycetales bacterium]|nr:aminotransferase class I/II-fold pyridoxal phosphate-dependent enzyme [Planctomycetales bacterium]
MNDGTLVHVLHSHFDHHANRMAISYDDGDGPLKLTYGQLGHRVESVAWQLASYGSKDDVACLVYDHGIDFVIGFLACLFTGIVAAPSSPPRASRNRDTNQRLERFVSICRQADPRLVLTTRELRPQIERGLQDTADPQIVCTDRVSEANSTHLQPDVRPDDIALLQYTSGSTGTPNGVMISHANLVANQQAIQRATGSSSSTVSVSWLPLFHDMGLVSGLLHPLYLGGLAVLMSPQQFTSNPMRWLEAISKYRATFTGGPNFAYELLADQVTYAERNSLDLSSLRVLYNGAEPIDAATMRRFVERFRACGLREGAIFPCYGLAESTLIVSGGPIDKSPTVRSVDRHSLELGMIQNAAEHADSVDLVSCGLPTDSKIIIADRSTQAALNRNEVGEIWVQSDSVGAGYYLDDDATAETFLNTLDGYDGTFLRTGDLGFIDERGELFVTGRCKDIIVVCGRNIYPQDVERCVSQVLSLSPRYRCVAVGLKRFGTEQIGLLVECNSELRKLARQSDKTEIEKLAAETRSEVNRVFDASVGIIAFTRTGSVPRTSSGKVRRQMCVELIEHSDCSIYRSTTLFEQKSPIQKSSQAAQLQLLLSTVLTPSQLKIIESVGESVTLEQLGVDSLTRASVASDIEKRLNITIEPAELSSKSDLGMLAKLISRAQKRRDAAPINTRNRHGVAKRQTRPSERDELPSSNGGRVYKLHAPQSIDSKETSLTDFVQRESRDIFEKTADFRGWYDDAAQRGYKRYLLPVLKHQGGRAIVGADEYSSQREVILFGSADYLGLAHSRRVKNAATESIAAHGCNVASVPLVAGSTPIHQQLEQAICDLLSHEACVLFPTGHSANMATIAALCSQQDTVIVDNRVHYSILEGARLAHCHWRTFVHNDPDSLKQVLECVRKQGADRGALVVLEGVYGIDGDLPLLDELVAVARAFDARVMLDDAHGIGVLGPRGEGTAAHLKANTRPDIVMGSLSKSIGSFGGFIATSRNVADYLRFYAKAISFAVGLPAANAAAGLEGLQIIGGQPERLESLRRKADFLRAALLDEGLRNVQRSESTIMSARIGDESLLRDITRELFDAGVWAEGLPFPAVARGQERLRFRVREVHDFD